MLNELKKFCIIKNIQKNGNLEQSFYLFIFMMLFCSYQYSKLLKHKRLRRRETNWRFELWTLELKVTRSTDLTALCSISPMSLIRNTFSEVREYRT